MGIKDLKHIPGIRKNIYNLGGWAPNKKIVSIQHDSKNTPEKSLSGLRIVPNGCAHSLVPTWSPAAPGRAPWRSQGVRATALGEGGLPAP